MKQKRFTHGITIFVPAEMYKELRAMTDALEISISDFIRGLIKEAFDRAEYVDENLDDAGGDGGKKDGVITRTR